MMPDGLSLVEMDALYSCLSASNPDQLLQELLEGPQHREEATTKVLVGTLVYHATEELVDEHARGRP